MPRYYVYELAYSDGTPFYRGKGTGSRIDFHEHEVVVNGGTLNPRKIAAIKSILKNGTPVLKRKLAFFDDEQEAYMYEWALINMTCDAEKLTNGYDHKRREEEFIGKRLLSSPSLPPSSKTPRVLNELVSFDLDNETLALLDTLKKTFHFSWSSTLVGYAIKRLAQQEGLC